MAHEPDNDHLLNRPAPRDEDDRPDPVTVASGAMVGIRRPDEPLVGERRHTIDNDKDDE